VSTGARLRQRAGQAVLERYEPADWFYPTRESLGAALMRDTSFEDAERVFRADLERNPKNGRSLFGLWQSLVAQGRTDDASRAQRDFRSAWQHADVQLRLRDFQIVARAQAPADHRRDCPRGWR
jgi:hypothetical protein